MYYIKNKKQYYILFSKDKSVDKGVYKGVDKKFNIISLDPGIKTFQSFYTPEGYVGSIGNNKLKEKESIN